MQSLGKLVPDVYVIIIATIPHRVALKNEFNNISKALCTVMGSQSAF